jgi:ATP-dependent DNA helicase PIF1
MALNEDQQTALDFAKQGKSFFLTGPGGTGKSYVIDRIRQDLEGQKRRVALTAMTGCAAVLLGNKAKTLHSWAAVGLAKEPAVVLIQKIRKYSNLAKRWFATDTLIVDEVSMMSPEFLEKLNAIAQAVRRDSRPMGGLQVIFVGDFFQLPPVSKGTEPQFVFECPLWSEIVPQKVELKKIERQQDPVFHKILDEARYGALTKESLAILRTRQNLDWKSLEIKPTLLFSRNADVDYVNDSNLKALRGEPHIYKAETVLLPIASTRGINKESEESKFAIQRLDRDAPYMSELVLKEGAQVMLLTNIDFDLELVNGSRGVVLGFTEDPIHLPIVKFHSGAEISIKHTTWDSDDIEGLQRQQIPLRLAYALTIHKSQGATLDCALIDIGTNTFDRGQAYVALSRVRSLECLYIWNLEKSAFKTHEKVISFYKNT